MYDEAEKICTRYTAPFPLPSSLLTPETLTRETKDNSRKLLAASSLPQLSSHLPPLLLTLTHSS
jgi:hypothetical protein